MIWKWSRSLLKKGVKERKDQREDGTTARSKRVEERRKSHAPTQRTRSLCTTPNRELTSSNVVQSMGDGSH